jgi:predicted enzyme related to lactoylglutathione lyase
MTRTPDIGLQRDRSLALLCVALALWLGACQALAKPEPERRSKMRVHYIEIVCRDVSAQCAALERLHGLSFGPPDPELGRARVAQTSDGTRIGVRAPLAEHEPPTLRTYIEVQDIASAVQQAEAAGAVIAYPPTRQGKSGTWAIYLLGDVQHGLWQR